MSAATSYRWITRRRGVCGGQPIIRGTRLPVRTLIACYKQGMSLEEILESFPGISPAQFHEAFAYYYDHQDEIEKLLRPITPEELAAELGLELTPEGFFVKERSLARK